MKKLLFAFGLLVSLFGKSQTVTIPDPAFATWIQQNYPTCISGNQLDTACINSLNISALAFQFTNISNLNGIQHFVDLQDLRILYCSNLTTIPGFPNSLQKLSCEFNSSLTSLPLLPNSLTNFACVFSNLSSLPVLPNSITKLQILSGGNFITLPSLPNSLIELDLGLNSNLTSLPTLPNSLAYFYCYSNNQLNSLPSLPNSLIFLRCSNNSNLNSLSTLSNSLTHLYCNKNPNLTSLPNLPNSLKFLDCSENNLNGLLTLPSAIDTIFCQDNNITGFSALPSSLVYFVCNDNNLTSLPAMSNSLKYLFCWNNSLNALPTLSNSLTDLDCSNNGLSSMPALPNTLNYLRCRNNNLSSLPTLSNSLNYLNCADNNLSNLPSLPLSLAFLNCDSNNLTSLPTLPNILALLSCEFNNITSLSILPNSLGYLDCSYNFISSLPPLPNSLTNLLCRNNLITSLPALSTSMFELNCSYNSNLTCIPNIPNGLIILNVFSTSITCLPNYNIYINPNIFNLPLCQLNSPNNPDNCPSSGVSGTVFLDSNNNCLYNINEGTIKNIPISIINNGNNINQQTSTYYNGNFGFINITNGNYTIKIDTTPAFLQSCTPSHTITLNATNPDTSNLDFGLQCKPNTFDLGTKSIIPVGPVFPGQQHALKVQAGDLSQFFNFNCTASQNISATVTVNVSGPVQYVAPAVSAITPTNVVGNILTYAISNISTTQLFNSFNSLFTTNTTAQAGDSVCVMVTITTPQSGDVDPLNNTFKYCYRVVNSYDPNIKVVNKAIVKPTFNDWLTYSIYFQNTGNAPAYNIKLVDTLDNALDLNTFEVINYSHENSIALNSSDRKLVVTYPNILLPDSNTNPLGSIGYIQYRIKPSAPMALNNQIKNKAGIYFDFNAPIVTNTVTTTATNSVGLANIRNKDEAMNLQPNPASQSLHVTLGKEKIDYISITELSGKVLLKKKVNVGDSKIYFDLSEIENGLYLVNGYLGEKIVKGKKLVVSK
jgi:uncharacterized repeat protein (TIGR01451 family)